MTVQLAPRPRNEERRVVAVKRTGLIDNNQEDNFSIFCDLVESLPVLTTLDLVYSMKIFSVLSLQLMVERMEKVNVLNLIYALTFVAQNQL